MIFFLKLADSPFKGRDRFPGGFGGWLLNAGGAKTIGRASGGGAIPGRLLGEGGGVRLTQTVTSHCCWSSRCKNYLLNLPHNFFWIDYFLNVNYIRRFRVFLLKFLNFCICSDSGPTNPFQICIASPLPSNALSFCPI